MNWWWRMLETRWGKMELVLVAAMVELQVSIAAIILRDGSDGEGRGGWRR